MWAPHIQQHDFYVSGELLQWYCACAGSSIYSPGAPTSAEGGISSQGVPIDIEGRLIGAGFVPHRGAHRCRAVAYKDDIYSSGAAIGKKR